MDRNISRLVCELRNLFTLQNSEKDPINLVILLVKMGSLAHDFGISGEQELAESLVVFALTKMPGPVDPKIPEGLLEEVLKGIQEKIETNLSRLEKTHLS